MADSAPAVRLPGVPDPSFQAIVGRLLAALRASDLVTDDTPGGVARTLMETVARELALTYEVLNRAHAAGYVASAEGEALDQVVALLGLSRARAGRLTGTVAFIRDVAADRDVAIPAGLRVSGRPARPREPAPLLEVVETTALKAGERQALVAVQEIPGEETPRLLSVDPGGIDTMPRPLLGIDRVTNRAAITRRGTNEDDATLRARAAAALRAGEQGTTEAIEAAVRALGVRRVTVVEPEGGPPGNVLVRVGDVEVVQDPESWAAVRSAALRAKAAGVRMSFEGTTAIAFGLVLDLTPDAVLDDAGARALQASVTDALGRIFDGLGPGDAVSARKLEGAALAVRGVRDATLTRATRSFPIQMKDGRKVAGTADTDRRALPAGQGWTLGPTEQAVLDLTVAPPVLTLRGRSS